MKVLQINSFGNLSTGRIATDIYRTLRDNGHDGMVAYGRGKIPNDVPAVRIGSRRSIFIDGVMTRLTDRAGFFSVGPTTQLIKKIKEYDPDIIHLHNLHGYYLNIEILFNYLKESGKPVVWTLHDCWAFTGHCAYFDFAGCQKWLTNCCNCPQKHDYPASMFLDKSENNFHRKKELFLDIDNFVIVTPSKWLAKLVDRSFLQSYPVKVIHNGVDLKMFKPTYGNWIKNHNLEDKKIILGVAGKWSNRKGLLDLIKMSIHLPDDYKVVIVGVDDEQQKNLPPNILGIKRTYDTAELAEIYTAAYVLVNPTYEDNFPNVNLESLATGTPVITYNTGGSPEVINGKNGCVVPKGNIEGLFQAVIDNNFSSDEALKSSKIYAREKSYTEYLNLYKGIIS